MSKLREESKVKREIREVGNNIKLSINVNVIEIVYGKPVRVQWLS